MSGGSETETEAESETDREQFAAPPTTNREDAIVEGETAVDTSMFNVPFSGPVPRVEPKLSHRLFVEGARPGQVMCKITHARQLLKRGETAESYFPDDVDVITTTTVRDGKLYVLPWEDNGYRMGEIDIVREFGPDYHIPTDYSAYVEQPDEKRRELQKKCMKGTIWMHRKLSDTDTEIIPLFKGVRPESRQMCYRVWDAIDADIAAYYAVTYFTRQGRRTERLIHDLEIVASETDTPLLLIGLLSPRTLERIPPNVIATAGQKQWRERVTPTEDAPQEIREDYEGLKSEVIEAMDLQTEPTTLRPAPTDVDAEDATLSQEAPGRIH